MSRSTTPEPGHAACQHSQNKVSRIDRWFVRKLLEALEHPPLEVVFWNGESVRGGQGPLVAVVVLKDSRLLKRLFVQPPSIVFGDGFTSGQIEIVGDLNDFCDFVSRVVERRSTRPSILFEACQLLSDRWFKLFRDDVKNIHMHYDIGNDFYNMWLDEDLVYSCAYFSKPGMSLHEAQVAKNDYICRKLDLKPGEKVVEIGGGWGALALHMAKRYGVTVRSYSLSTEQVEFAKEQATRMAMSDHVEFIHDDYRNIQDECDVVVSVGMLEHVGISNFDEFGSVVSRCIESSGRGLVQSIGRISPGRVDAWMQRRIFPGGEIPSLVQILKILEDQNYPVLDVENLGGHYALTLEHWIKRFDSIADSVTNRFSPQFTRTWRLYLAGAHGAFASGAMQLFQVLFSSKRTGATPLTRSHLYTPREVPIPRDANS